MVSFWNCFYVSKGIVRVKAEDEKGKMHATVVEAEEKVVNDEGMSLILNLHCRASHSHYFTLFLLSFSVLFLVFGGAMFLGGFSVKFIAEFGCEISWVDWVLQRDSVGFFWAF